MSTVTREFAEADRYLYDRLLIPQGFAQVDTGSDASWYGIWAHPGRRVVFAYAEGDCTTTECETAAEFIQELERLQAWHRQHDRFLGVDPGSDPANRQAWIEAGCGEFLHPSSTGQPQN
jgi:hypothetical protein